MVIFSDFSGLAALSVDDACRDGGFGRGEAEVESNLDFGVEAPPFADCVFIPFSERTSLLEKRRLVNRFVIEGLTGCASDCG